MLTNPIFERSRLAFSDAALKKLINSKILIAGVGGVGGFVAEALARAGMINLTLLDHDTVSPSNLNRQIIALESTLGRPKVNVMRERILDINPLAKPVILQEFVTPETIPQLLDNQYDFVVDAIDSLNCKVALVAEAYNRQVGVVSSMGAGRRIDPSQIKLVDISQTHTCGLARAMRHRLGKQGIKSGIDVIFSTEAPLPAGPYEEIEGARGRVVNGTTSYMPGIFGLMLAGWLIKKITQET